MPIVFEPQAPVSPAISSLYGEAQQFSQDAPNIAGLQRSIASTYGDTARLRVAASEGEANRRQQAALTTAELNQRSDLFQQQREDAAMQFNAGLHQRSLEAQFGMQARMGEQQQHAELQNWLGQQDMSYKEKMRLQQMQNAVGEINADDTLTPDEKTNYVRQIRTGIDVGKQRLQQEQARKIQLANGQQDDVLKQAAQHNQTLGEFLAANAHKRFVYDRTPDGAYNLDEDGNPVKIGIFDHNGDFKELKPAKAAGADRLPPGTMNEAQWQTAVKHVRDRVEKMVGPKTEEGKLNPGWDSDKKDEAVNNDMIHQGLGYSYQDYLTRRKGGQQPGAAPSPQPGQQAPPPLADAKPAGQAAAPRITKFDPDKPDEWGPAAKAWMFAFVNNRNEVMARPDLPQPVKQEAVSAMQAMRDIVAKGDLTERDRTDIATLNQLIQRLVPPPPRPPASPPAARTGFLTPQPARRGLPARAQ